MYILTPASRMSVLILAVTLFATFSGVGSASAAELDGAAVMRKMKTALEPPQPSIRRYRLDVSPTAAAPTEVLVGEARQPAAGAGRTVVVVLAPAELRGTSLLIQEGAQGSGNPQWVYLPSIARVRKIVASEAFTSFLNSDFTYADLGFVDLAMAHTWAGEEERDGVRTYRIESIPRETWWYGRIVTWVDATSFLPIERHLFSPARHLWKIQRWSQIDRIDGIATPMHISMEDVPNKTRSDLRVTAVRYNAQLPQALFDPSTLPTAVELPEWQSIGTVARH